MLGVSDIQRLIRRTPLVSVIRLVTQVPGGFDPFVSSGQDLDRKRFLVFHRDDTFRCRSTESMKPETKVERSVGVTFHSFLRRRHSRQTGNSGLHGRFHGFRQHVLGRPVRRVGELQ